MDGPYGSLNFHEHIRKRLTTRGISEAEVRSVLEHGWPGTDAQPSTGCLVLVFPFNATWEGRHYEEKEVTVFKVVNDELLLLTAKARYGFNFPRVNS
jgi:hypothetical protein